MKHALPLALLLTLPFCPLRAQDLTNNGATISLSNGAVLWVGGALTNASGTLDLSSGAPQLYVGRNLTNAAGATLTPGTGSTVTLNGAAEQQLDLQGAGLANLIVRNAAGLALPAGSNANITGTLTLTSGSVTVHPSAALRLLNGATLTGEQAGRYVRGPLVAVRSVVPAGAATAFANGFTLTPTATLTNLAVTRRAGFTAAHVSYGTSGNGTYNGIDRIWATSTAVTGAVQLSWLADDDNGLTNFSQTQVWARTAAPVAGSDWGRIGGTQDGRGRSAEGAVPDGIPASYFTVSTADAPLGSRPLPVTLMRFTAERQGDGALLRWATATEVNNERFEVEVSVDGAAFRRLGTVAGQGTSYQGHEYRLLDPALLRYGAEWVYYRLRQVDQDGTFTYSPVRPVQVPSGAAALTVVVFPNPAADQLTIHFSRPEAGQAQGWLLDAQGRKVQELSPHLTAASGVDVPVSVQHLPNGVYTLRLVLDGQVLHQQVVVQR